METDIPEPGNTTRDNPYATPKSDVDVPLTAEVELASRWARLGGSIIDGILITLVVLPLMYVTGYFQRALEQAPTLAETLAWTVAGAIAFVLINGYLLANAGQTAGKRIVGTRIVSVEDGRILPLWKVVGVRWLPWSLAAQVPVVGPFVGIANVLAIFRRDKRCLHDLVAGSHVIKA